MTLHVDPVTLLTCQLRVVGEWEWRERLQGINGVPETIISKSWNNSGRTRLVASQTKYAVDFPQFVECIPLLTPYFEMCMLQSNVSRGTLLPNKVNLDSLIYCVIVTGMPATSKPQPIKDQHGSSQRVEATPVEQDWWQVEPSIRLTFPSSWSASHSWHHTSRCTDILSR